MASVIPTTDNIPVWPNSEEHEESVPERTSNDNHENLQIFVIPRKHNQRQGTEVEANNEQVPDPITSFSILDNFFTWIVGESLNPTQPKKKKCLAWLRKIFWITSTCLAIFGSLALLKYPILDLKHGKGKQNEDTYIRTALNWIILVGKFYLLGLILDNDKLPSPSVAKFIEKKKQYASIVDKKYAKLPAILLASSIGMAISSSLLGFTKIRISKYWNFGALTIIQYEDTADAFMDWGGNGTLAEADQASQVAFTGIVSLGFFTEFGKLLTDLLLRDLFIMLALALKLEVDKLNMRLKECDGTNDHKSLYADIMEHYNFLTLMSNTFNKAFGPLLILLHFNNLFVFVYLMDCIINVRETGTFLWLLFILSKSGIAYSICISTSGKIQNLYAWFRNDQTREILDMNSNIAKYTTVMEQMNRNPIGLGSDDFHINWRFARKFSSLIITYFFVIAKSSAEKQKV